MVGADVRLDDGQGGVLVVRFAQTRGDTSAPAVQARAGHLHLTTTHIYAPLAHADLQDTLSFFRTRPPETARGAMIHAWPPEQKALSNHLIRARPMSPVAPTVPP